MTWNRSLLPDEPQPFLGPGISRPKPKQLTRLFSLEVQCPGTRLMHLQIPAPSKADAIRYCKNRWPDATITFIR
jgi:hypothetical protein